MTDTYIQEKLTEFGEELKANTDHYTQASALSSTVEHYWHQAIMDRVEAIRKKVLVFGLRLTHVTSNGEPRNCTASIEVQHNFDEFSTVYGSAGKSLAFEFNPRDLHVHVLSAGEDNVTLNPAESLEIDKIDMILIDHAVAILRGARLRPVERASTEMWADLSE